MWWSEECRKLLLSYGSRLPYEILIKFFFPVFFFYFVCLFGIFCFVFVLGWFFFSFPNSYKLTGGDSQFTINPSTGQIITSALLDRESRENYTLVVVASDGGFPRALSSSTSVLVAVADVNDNPPKFQHHPYVTHVPSPTTSGNLISDSVWGTSHCISILPNAKLCREKCFWDVSQQLFSRLSYLCVAWEWIMARLNISPAI